MRNFFPVDDEFTNPFFVASVEDNNDPTFNYRVKVRIDKLHGETITTEQLPWAARVDTAFMGVGDEQDLDHKIPEVGTQVLVLAVGNDINSLLYLGSLYKKTAQTPAGDDYLNTYGIYRKDGQFIGVDKIKKLFQLLFDGEMNIDKVTKMTIKVSDEINIETSTTTITASGGVNIKGGPVTIEKGTNVGWCCLKQCLFTSALHVENVSS
jgi:phage baseplate assembly protein gpV